MTVKQYMNKVAALNCILCRHLGLGESPACLHHPKTGGMRASDWDVIPLCYAHHQGPVGVHGLGRKAFERCYGLTERDLLDLVRQQLAP